MKVWMDDSGVYLPRDLWTHLPPTMKGGKAGELLAFIMGSGAVPGWHQFGQVTVIVQRGEPPRDTWADPAAGVL